MRFWGPSNSTIFGNFTLPPLRAFWTRNQKDEEFVGNTFWYNGASAGYMPGKSPLVSDNWVVGQCDGMILNDGSGITTGVSKIFVSWFSKILVL